MNNFSENATKVYFGKGCVKEYLVCLTKGFEGTVMLAYGGGSVKRNGIYDEVLKRRTGRDYPEYNPKIALLDPVYTYSVPKFQMVSGGFDTLFHIMEIYFSEPHEPNVSDDIAEALMRG